ncbi:MAG: ankyrin repeat domain-containing protein [Pseudomonadota bacterium]
MSKSSSLDLLDAVRRNDLKAVEKLFLNIGVNTRQDDVEKNNALHIAAQFGDAAMVRFLIAQGVDADKLNQNQNRPIDLARRFKNRDAIDALLYPQNATLTDKIQIALAQTLYVDDKGKVATSSQIKNLQFIDQIMLALADGNLDSNSKLADKIQEILFEQNTSADPKLSELKTEIWHLILTAEAKFNEPRFSDESYLGQKIKTQNGINQVEPGDHFIKIANKKSGAAKGAIVIKRILRPSNLLVESKSKKYLHPWVVKSIDKDSIGEDLVNSYVNYFGLQPKFRKLTLQASGGLEKQKQYIAVKYNLDTHHPERLAASPISTKSDKGKFASRVFGAKTQNIQVKSNPTNKLIEQIFLAIILGHGDLNNGNVLVDNLTKEILFIDWDVMSVRANLIHPVLQRYFVWLVEAINKGDFKEVREILSFRKLKNIHTLIGGAYGFSHEVETIKAIKKLDKRTVELLELDQADLAKSKNKLREIRQDMSAISVLGGSDDDMTVIELLEKSLSEISDSEILASIQSITNKNTDGLKAITHDFIELEAGADQDSKVAAERKYKTYENAVLTSLAQAKKAVDGQVAKLKNPLPPKSTNEKPVVYLDFNPTGKTLVTHPIEPDHIIKYWAGLYHFVDNVDWHDKTVQYKGIVPKEFLIKPQEIYKMTFASAIKKIKNQQINDEAWQMLSIAFPLIGSYGLELDGGLFQPRIADEARFKEEWWKYSEQFQDQVCENIILAISALKKFATTQPNVSNCNKLLLFVKRAEKSLDLFGDEREDFVAEQKEELNFIKAKLQEAKREMAPEKSLAQRKPTTSTKSPNAQPLLKMQMVVVEKNGKYHHHFEFENEKNNFCFVANQEITNKNLAYRQAQKAIELVVSELIDRQSVRFERACEEILDYQGNNKSLLNLKKIIQEESPNNEHQKAILAFIIKAAKASQNGFSKSEIVAELPPQLAIDLKHISAKMQEYNKDQGLFDNKKSVGMRSCSMKVDYLESDNSIKKSNVEKYAGKPNIKGATLIL